jgi:putative ABC transport system permease protein
VLLRNVLERRRELAVLRAVGYTRRHLAVMIVAENLFLLISGLVTGALCAALAIAPAFLARGSKPTIFSMALLLVTVLATGTAVSVLAAGVALHSPLLPALRKE